ncbi:FIST signal transduction protein [Hydrogenophaga soli]
MHILQRVVNAETVTPADLAFLAAAKPHLVLVFASLEAMMALDVALLHDGVPGAQWVGCSTAGEISSQGVADHSMVLTALHFDRPDFQVASVPLKDMADSFAAGERLGSALAHPELKHALVLGQGAHINGSALVEGLKRTLGPQVVLTGGLAGDGGRFTGARVLGPEGVSDTGLVAIGFRGPNWHITHGSFGGWQRFGPIRNVTHAEGNVLYALDGEPALDIYKRYLGDYAAQLPASGLLFPWSVLGADVNDPGITRTILGVDEAAGSLILAGDVPQGGHLQLMHASVDVLVDAAERAARVASQSASPPAAQVTGDTLAVLVSCIGRKLVMGPRVDEEVEAVARVAGPRTTLAGFYSNGEISPHAPGSECRLHNQTMTITLVSEVQS